MILFDKLLSQTALVKAKNKQHQQYSDPIPYLFKLLHDMNDNIQDIDYAEMAKRKATLCNELFSQLKEEQQKNKELKRQLNDLVTKYENDTNELIMAFARREGEILSLKHMLDRYEVELDKLRKG